MGLNTGSGHGSGGGSLGVFFGLGSLGTKSISFENVCGILGHLFGRELAVFTLIFRLSTWLSVPLGTVFLGLAPSVGLQRAKGYSGAKNPRLTRCSGCLPSRSGHAQATQLRCCSSILLTNHALEV